MNSFSEERFNGRSLNVNLPNHQVRVILSPDEKLSIQISELSRGKLNQDYIAHVKLEDIKRQSQKNAIETIIQTPTQLFLLLEENIKSNSYPVDKMIQITVSKEVKLSLDIRLDFKTGTKRKSVVYCFKTIKKMDKFPDSLSNHNLTTKIEQLEEENNVIKRQLHQIRQMLELKSAESVYLLDKFQLMPSTTMFLYGNSIVSLSRDINYLFLKKPIDPLQFMNLKFRVSIKSLIFFCIFKYKDLSVDSESSSFKSSDFQTWLCFNGGEIVTILLNEYKYTVIVQKNEIEEVSIDNKQGEDNLPNFSYSKNRKIVQFKKLIPFDHLHFGIGLEFGGKLEMLNLDYKKE